MRHCYILRVFTRGRDGGNHLGVVTDVSGLNDQVMQQVATDLGFSETVFIDWRKVGIPQARIFTPARELPFAGHPLVGAAWVLNVIGPGGVPAVGCAVGESTIVIRGDVVGVTAPEVDRPVRRGTFDVAGWVDPVEVLTVSMPIDYHMVQVAGPDEVTSASPPQLAGDIYLWAWDGDMVKARFFAPELGVVEDPATGSAAVALAAVMTHQGRRTGSVEVRQGDEIGAPSTIHLEWSGNRVSIAGTVVRDETRELDV